MTLDAPKCISIYVIIPDLQMNNIKSLFKNLLLHNKVPRRYLSAKYHPAYPVYSKYFCITTEIGIYNLYLSKNKFQIIFNKQFVKELYIHIVDVLLFISTH